MPIEQNRLLALIAAAEDALAGLERVGQMVEKERERVEAGAETPEDALRNLELLLVPIALLDRPNETRETILAERIKMSPRRVRENQRRKERAKSKSERKDERWDFE